MWLNLILEVSQSLRINNDFEKIGIGICIYDIVELINNMPNIISLVRTKELKTQTINNPSELINLHNISKYATPSQIAILGENIIEKLINSITRNQKEIINMASELICLMSKRSKSTIPYICGETENYKYSMYDHLDETILLSGINTNACFRIGGIDNDFLHYCALNKNGFIIKITDQYDHFIARASGFRNGNAVYINQLRTIHDESRNKYNSKYKNEQNDIIATFKKACIDIVSTSQTNNQEQHKIDFVFVTKSYSLNNYESNISPDLKKTIDKTPMDNQSEDWHNYLEKTNNLNESKKFGYFNIDYSVYPIICMASIKDPQKIQPSDIKSQDVPALYERSRTSISITNHLNALIYKRLNKINAIKSFFANTSFEKVDIPRDSIIYTGDNWYIISNNHKVISSCILNYDEKARLEFKATLKTINNIYQSDPLISSPKTLKIKQ